MQQKASKNLFPVKSYEPQHRAHAGVGSQNP
jgi:hypothetical protein